MKCVTISKEDILKDNPRICLSPKRYTGKCFTCPSYESHSGVPCDSRIVNEEGEMLLQKQKELIKAIKILQKELEEIQNEIA